MAAFLARRAWGMEDGASGTAASCVQRTRKIDVASVRVRVVEISRAGERVAGGETVIAAIFSSLFGLPLTAFFVLVVFLKTPSTGNDRSARRSASLTLLIVMRQGHTELVDR